MKIHTHMFSKREGISPLGLNVRKLKKVQAGVQIMHAQSKHKTQG